MNLLVALELGALAGLIIVGLGFLGVVVGAPGWHCANPTCRAFNGAAKEWLTHCRCCGQAGGQDP